MTTGRPARDLPHACAMHGCKLCVECMGHCRTCPTTRQRLRHLELIPNHTLRMAIEEWCARSGVDLPARSSPPLAETIEGEASGAQGARDEGASEGLEMEQVVVGHDEIVWAVLHAGNVAVTGEQAAVALCANGGSERQRRGRIAF